MPILVRPVREQLEHDRIIRLLEAKWRRKFKVDANPGDERNAGIKVPAGTIFPDSMLTEEGGRKPKALIEVETDESVNHLEAMAQWANLAKSRTSLLLFVPAGAVESARRLADENSIKLAELWTYLVLGDQVRFTSVFRENGARAGRPDREGRDVHHRADGAGAAADRWSSRRRPSRRRRRRAGSPNVRGSSP